MPAGITRKRAKITVSSKEKRVNGFKRFFAVN